MNTPAYGTGLQGRTEAEVERLLNPDRDRGEPLPHLAGLDASVRLELGVMAA